MPYCRSCGEEVQADWKACPSCGQLSPTLTQRPSRAEAQGSNALLEWMRTHLVLTGIISAVVLALFAIALATGSYNDNSSSSRSTTTERADETEAPAEEASGSETFDGTTVSRTFPAEDEWDEVAFFRDSYQESAELIPQWLAAYPDAEDFRITWEITLIDQYGAENDETGAEVHMTRPVGERIQWNNMTRDRLYRLAQSDDGITYRLHPAVLREIEFD